MDQNRGVSTEEVDVKKLQAYTVKNFRKKTETVIWFYRKKLLEYKIIVNKPKIIVFKHAIRKITEKM